METELVRFFVWEELFLEVTLHIHVEVVPHFGIRDNFVVVCLLEPSRHACCVLTLDERGPSHHRQDFFECLFMFARYAATEVDSVTTEVTHPDVASVGTDELAFQ